MSINTRGHGAKRRVYTTALAFYLSMIFSDLPSPAEAGFAKAGNRFSPRIKSGLGFVRDHTLTEILWPQLDRLAVRRAVGGVVPGIVIARERVAIGDVFLGDEMFERVEPVPVVGFAGIGIAGRLRALDLG